VRKGRFSLGLTVGLFGLMPAFVSADELPDLVERAKPSVVLLGTFGVLDSPRFTFRGTGFVVGSGNHVITSAHVLPDASAEFSHELKGQKSDRFLALKTITREGQWVLREVSVEALDVLHDLALLRFKGPPSPALKVAGNGAAREGTAIALIGFPLGGVLGYSHVTHRGILAARTAIAPPASGPQGLNARTLLQIRQGAFEILQLDAIAYPGNSGGPVFDIASGEVIGVVSMVLVKGTKESAMSIPTGITYAIPSPWITQLIGQ
jgi:S1-C subfamily serine protease